MFVGLAVILGALLLVAIVTAAVFSFVRKLRGGRGIAITSGGLFAPVFIAVVGSFGVFLDHDVDGPPPGMVLLGLWSVSAILLPITFSISLLLVRIFPPAQVDSGR